MALVSALDATNRARHPEEGWFQHIIEASPCAMLVAEGAGVIAFANRAAELLFGYDRNDMTGRAVEFLIPAWRRAGCAALAVQLAGPEDRPMDAGRDLYGCRKDGSEVPVEISLSPAAALGEGAVLVTITDISARRYEEEAIRLAVEAAPNPMIAADANCKIVLVNRAGEDLFGYSRAELPGLSIDILVPSRFRANHPRLAEKYLTHPRARPLGRGRELFARKKGGAEIPVEIGLNSIETPRGRFILASIIDITRRRRYENELRRSQREAVEDTQRAEEQALLLRRLWDEITALAIRCGLPGAGITPAFLTDACQDPSHVEEKLAAVLSTFETAFRGYADANRKLAAQNRLLVAARAVTEAANRELEAFSYSVAHDLRSPLRSVDGFCQILDEEYSSQLDETGRGYLDRVRRAAQHMGTLIDDLLRLARITQGGLTRTEVNLSALAVQIKDNLCDSAPGRKAEFVIASGMRVSGDPRLLRVVLENLFSNAWKFTSAQPAARIEFGSEPDGGQPVFYVRDNGAGFDMAYSGKLFGAFQRLHSASEFPGTGIGLATVQRIIAKHGGRIWAEAEPGKGATFRFVL